MTDHAPRYPSYDPGTSAYEDREAYEERPAGHPVAPYRAGRPARANDGGLPLFLSDADGEPDPSEYVPSFARPRSSYTGRVLASVSALAALGLLAALVSSDSARDFIRSAQASTTAALSAASAAVQPNGTQSKTPRLRSEAPLKETAQFTPPVAQVPVAGTVAVAAVTPTREDIKSAYQSAMQGSAPQAAPVPEATAPAETIRHLEANEIAALVQRANGLIASGDVAAARLVLRRAAEAGDGHAAMILGGTYDSLVLEKLGVRGIVPDLGLARNWYEKARRFGAPEAAAQIELLANRQR